VSYVTDHWEWDGFWSARRRGRSPALLGHTAPESDVRVDVGGTEVAVRPGLCVAWTASEGHCSEPADGLACVKHAEDFAPLEARRTRLTAEDVAYLDTLSGTERERARKRLSMKRSREDSEYNDKQNAHRRAMRGARIWTP
jgi:hypothetical protein